MTVEFDPAKRRDTLAHRGLDMADAGQVFDGNTLTVERNQRKFSMPLGQYPELAAFIESIRATLAGNRYALEAVYKVAISGRGDDWTLTLTPINTRMQKVVSTITLDGTDMTFSSDLLPALQEIGAVDAGAQLDPFLRRFGVRGRGRNQQGRGQQDGH